MAASAARAARIDRAGWVARTALAAALAADAGACASLLAIYRRVASSTSYGLWKPVAVLVVILSVFKAASTAECAASADLTAAEVMDLRRDLMSQYGIVLSGGCGPNGQGKSKSSSLVPLARAAE